MGGGLLNRSLDKLSSSNLLPNRSQDSCTPFSLQPFTALIVRALSQLSSRAPCASFKYGPRVCSKILSHKQNFSLKPPSHPQAIWQSHLSHTKKNSGETPFHCGGFVPRWSIIRGWAEVFIFPAAFQFPRGFITPPVSRLHCSCLHLRGEWTLIQ